MGCFSCFPREKKQRINCLWCFPAEVPAEGKKRNMNCFPCFRAQDATEGTTRIVNCFSCCFQTRAKKDPRRKMNCFPCFQRNDLSPSEKDLTEGKTRRMNCFMCFQAQKKKDSTQRKKRKWKEFSCFPTKVSTRKIKHFSCFSKPGKIRCKKLRIKGKCGFLPGNKKRMPANDLDHDDLPTKKNKNDALNHTNKNIVAKIFTFSELATATKNFKEECIVGEGGFGRVYKGKLEGEMVAVKQLSREGKQGNKEFLAEIMMLSHLCHPHLVNLVGYCAEGDQRLLVYEYMPAGSLENHLLDLPRGKQPLDWATRIKVALHAAKGLEYLHETNKPPIIYRDLKSSNILLDKDFNAKLSDFGLARLCPVGDKAHVTSRVMGTLGYCAPEYQRTGRLNVKSDIYSYGVVLLELITGRRAVDLTRNSEELHLVRWAETRIKDPHKYSELVDPLLEGNYPRAALSQVLAIGAMCLSADASVRPSSSDVVEALAALVEEPL